jgi:ABC-type multidrug transport system fused ATPase/permease subunit
MSRPRILPYLYRNNQFALAALWLTGVIAIGLSLVAPAQIGDLTDQFSKGDAVTWSAVNRAILLILGAQLVVSLLAFWQKRLELTLFDAMVRALSLDLVGRLLRFSADFFKEREVERILTPALDDTHRVARFWIGAAIRMPLAVASLVIIGGLMLAQNWLLGTCLILLSLLSGHFIFFDGWMQRVNQKIAEKWDRLRVQSGEVVAGVAELRNNAALDYGLGKVRQAYADYVGWTGRQNLIVALFGAMNPLVTTVQTSVLYWVGAVLCLSGSGLAAFAGALTWGEVITFMLLAQLFQRPVTQIIDVITDWRMAQASTQRVREYLERPCVFTVQAQDAPPPGGAGEVAYEEVAVTAAGGQPILEGVSLHVTPGQHVAITGPAGSGKSTALHLLTRETIPSAGRVRVAARPIDGYDLLALARLVGVAPQKPALFNTTIRHNILLGLRRPSPVGITDEEGFLDLSGFPDVKDQGGLDRKLLAVARLVGLEDDLLRKALDRVLAAGQIGPALGKRVATLRAAVLSRLSASGGKLLVPLESDSRLAGGDYDPNRTVRENLLGASVNTRVHGAVGRVDGAIRAALEAEGCLEEVLLLGLDVPVGEGGKYLSGGQRQKIAIARAVLKNPRLLLLDEATASLDEISQSRIFALVRRELAEVTVLSVSHRLAPIKQFDRVLVFDRGQVVQDGPYPELARREGLFRLLLAHERGEQAPAPPASPAPGDERQELRRWLALCPLFASLDSSQLAFLERVVRVEEFEQDTVLFQRGDPGSTFYLILEGQVAFFIDHAEAGGPRREVVDTHAAGQSFGELAMFGTGRRTLGALAVTPLRLGALERDDLLQLMRADAGIAVALLQTVSRRLADARERLYGEAPREPGPAAD